MCWKARKACNMLDLAIQLTGQNANLHLADKHGPQRLWNNVDVPIKIVR